MKKLMLFFYMMVSVSNLGAMAEVKAAIFAHDQDHVARIYDLGRIMAEISTGAVLALVANDQLPQNVNRAVRQVVLASCKAVNSSAARAEFDRLIQQLPESPLKRDIRDEVAVYRRKLCVRPGQFASVDQAINHVHQSYEYMLARIAVLLATNF